MPKFPICRLGRDESMKRGSIPQRIQAAAYFGLKRERGEPCCPLLRNAYRRHSALKASTWM
jgi:hypothetical protein